MPSTKQQSIEMFPTKHSLITS